VSVRAAWLLLAAAWGGSGIPAAAQRSYAIDRFDAAIQVQRDGTIRVTETIVARFVGSWNGIYRTVPITYRTPRGLNWTVGVHLESATDGEGRGLRVEASREGYNVKFKIWVPGAQNATRTVVLRYRASNGLRFFDEHDELYWNVTGDEWDVPIGAAAARIELPAGTEGIRAIAFNGAYGSTAQEAKVQTSGTTVSVTMPHALGYREGLTAVVGWNKGVVAEPSAAARVAQAIASNWPLGIPIPVLLFAYASWLRRGRDPRRRPITVQYEPPPDVTPAEAGTLIDNSADLRDITATLVDLAVRGHLRIEEREEEKFFGLFGSRVYELRRLQPPAGAPAPAPAPELAPHEQRVLHGIFDGRGSLVPLSRLESEFYRELPGIRTSIFDRLLARGYYHARPDRVRRRWMVGGLVLGSLVAVGGGFIAAAFLLTFVPFLIAGALVALILLGFSRIMPARTEAGSRALEQILGFEEFLRRVEAEHLKRVIIGHPELFDRFLPYAMALGVERKCAHAFEGIYTEPPTWYVGPSVTAFSPSRFSIGLGDWSSKLAATMTSGPRSQVGSTSSGPHLWGGSGFGGGGFSGGGGGGGGGGAF
jgi:hypothetical protein